jgi:hypothetical protein
MSFHALPRVTNSPNSSQNSNAETLPEEDENGNQIGYPQPNLDNLDETLEENEIAIDEVETQNIFFHLFEFIQNIINDVVDFFNDMNVINLIDALMLGLIIIRGLIIIFYILIS